MQAIDVITSLTTAPSRTRREQIILDAYAANCLDFFEAVQLAADPFITFGVKKVAEIMEEDNAPGSLTFVEFRRLCERLRTQSLFDESAHVAIHAAAERCHVHTWNALYRRVLLKDLRVVDTVMFNRLLKRLGPLAERFIVPTFRAQTAIASLSNPKSGQYLADAKLDGDRRFAVLDKTATLFNSEGERCETTAAYLPILQALAARLPSPMVLDGVVIGDGDYVLFDMVPLADFRLRYSSKTQSERRLMLEVLQASGAFAGTRQVRVLPQIEINFSSDEGRRAYTEFCRLAQEQGFTSVVVKRPDGLYFGKQNRAWMLCPVTIT